MTAVTVKGQVTIPKAVPDALNIGPGSQVEFVANREGAFVLSKSEPGQGEHPFDRLLGILGPGLFTDEVMALTRGEH
jgi:AbrB family looped-hinge helix DNA binding protein